MEPFFSQNFTCSLYYKAKKRKEAHQYQLRGPGRWGHNYSNNATVTTLRWRSLTHALLVTVFVLETKEMLIFPDADTDTAQVIPTLLRVTQHGIEPFAIIRPCARIKEE